MLARNDGHPGKVRFFRDSQIEATDYGITGRVTQEVASANAFLVLLWARYFERTTKRSH